jgi:hypothetical protein
VNGKKAIITLMRGNPGDYRRWQDNTIVLRNKSVDINLKNKCDFIIFHEGNLTKEHQSYVVQRSLISSPIKFVEVPDYKTLDIEFRKRLIDRGVYESGYASMCKFWFTTFIEHLSEYDYVIRIDDDCIVDTNVDQVFDELVDRYIVAPQMSEESHRIGLIEFINEFLQNNNIELDDANFGESFKGPYTNYCGFNLDKIRNNPIIMDYIKQVKDSEYIYTKNWQDVSLWGSVMRCFLNEDDYKELKGVSYFHLSHLNYPNGKRKK